MLGGYIVTDSEMSSPMNYVAVVSPFKVRVCVEPYSTLTHVQYAFQSVTALLLEDLSVSSLASPTAVAGRCVALFCVLLMN